MVRRCGRKSWGIGLAEALTAMTIITIIGGTIAAIYMASMRAYAQGVTENYAQQKASWAVQRMGPDIRLGLQVVPGDAPFSSSYIAIHLPARVFDSARDARLNQIALDADGQAYLLPGEWVVYYRGDADGALSATGDRLWRKRLAADGATLLQTDMITDHLVDNPVNPDTGLPEPIFTYWPDIFRVKSVEISLTVRERFGQRTSTAAVHGEFMLRNH